MAASAEPVAIKQEPDSSVNIAKRITELCTELPEGVSDAVLQTALPNTTPVERVAALNSLLKAGRIMVFKKKAHGGAGQLLYRLKDTSSSSSTMAAADSQEKLVFQIISAAGKKGIWIRDIRLKTNLAVPQLNKLVKSMQSKKLIKAVKAVNASKKNLYMLYDLEPDTTVTGGAWYNEDRFDQEFADLLNEHCFRFLQQKAASAKETTNEPLAQQNGSQATAQEVLDYITSIRISNINLTVGDIVDVLNTLIYDGKIAETVKVEASGSDSDGVKVYRALKPMIRSTGFVTFPCGVCQVKADCTDSGPISPKTCVYMKEWLGKLEF